MLSQAVAKNKGINRKKLMVAVEKFGEFGRFFVDFGWICCDFWRVKKGKLPLGFFASRKTLSAPEKLVGKGIMIK